MDNIQQKLLLAVVFLLPLLSTYKGYGYEHIKVLFFIFSITLIGLIWRGQNLKWSLISKIAGLFVLVLLLTSFTGINFENSLLGNQPYLQGWILYCFLYLFYLLVKTGKIGFKNYAQVLSISSSMVAFLAIKDWVLINILHQPIPTYAGRVVSTFGQPNFYAGFLLLVLPFTYLLLESPDKKLQFLGWGSGLISYIGIIVSYSRSAILLSLILLLLVLVYQLKIKKLVLFIPVILIGAIFLSVNSSSGFIWKEFIIPASLSNPDLTKVSVENRIYIWPQAVKIGLQKPVLGYGLENINLAFSGYFKTNKHPLFEENLNINPVLISLKELNIDRTHNYIIDLLLFSGILGVLSWGVLIFMLFKKLLQSKVSLENTGLLFALTLYLIWVQFQNQSIAHLAYFWLIAGLIDSG